MKNSNYTLGLVSVSFRNNSPREIVEAVKKSNLEVIEWGSDIHAPCNDINKLNEIVALQNEYGIKCSSYGTYFRLGVTPIDELEAYINAAKILGTDTLRMWCSNENGADMVKYKRDVLIAHCRMAAKLAEKHNVTLCLECHQKTFTERYEDAVWLMNEIDSPNFRMYWQPFQWQTVSENIAGARKLAPYTEHLHVFNWRFSEKLQLIDGIDDWRAYLKELTAPRTLLLEFMPNGSIDELPIEADALRRIIEVDR